jgi:maleylpyruvate isomerase
MIPSLDDAVAGCAAAHQRLLAHLDDLDDGAARGASQLPGWTVGHVLTHLARHAESQLRLLDGARRGEGAERYPQGGEGRDADIEAGAARPAAELVADVRRTIWDLEGAWASLPAEAWTVTGSSFGKPERADQLPFKRWREVEIHHADLGLAGFSSDDWSEAYVRYELRNAEMHWRATHGMGLTPLPEAALAQPPRRRLAWLVGRLTVAELGDPPAWF